MTTTTTHAVLDGNLHPLGLRRALGREDWGVPERFGPEDTSDPEYGDTQGWVIRRKDKSAVIIVTLGPTDPEDLGTPWVHASISRPDRTPDYADLVTLHRAVWGEGGWSYQVFAPASEHVNIHQNALHLWGRPDGSAILPNFGALGSI